MAFPGHGGGRCARLYCSGVPLGVRVGDRRELGGMEANLWQCRRMPLFFSFFFFFFTLGLPSWVSSAFFHRAVEVGSIRAASFSIKLGF